MKLYYYLYRKFTDMPHRKEVMNAVNNCKLPPVTEIVAEKYAYGLDIESIAKDQVITRERARQHLFKAIRIANYRKNSFICFAYSINDVNGQPKGFVWLTACFMDGNFRLFPIGYRK